MSRQNYDQHFSSGDVETHAVNVTPIQQAVPESRLPSDDLDVM